MADTRSARSTSRRKTPTPQPSSKAAIQQAGRASRARGLRSASRDIDAVVEFQKPTRRSARQASVATVTSESEHEGKATRKTRRKPAHDPVGDLTTVEEIDTLIALDEAPGTPERTRSENSLPNRSPGAASEMSGTTAISSFSMVEAEFLEPKYILKHLRKLSDSAGEFLEHLAPDSGGIANDQQNIHEIQKPDSDFTEEYRDFDAELNVHLRHFKDDEHNYINLRAIHRALFGDHRDVASAPSGLDLILYLTNLLVFAKSTMPSDRNAKDIWDALRQFDNSFPGHFMRSIIIQTPTAAGESALLKETFDLALDLRTQLAILVLEHSISDISFNPDDVIGEVFFRSEASQVADGSLIRGWNVLALGSDESALPEALQNLVIERMNAMRGFFPTDDDSLANGETVDLEGLGANFPWEATILRLLHWVRLRHRELQVAIDGLGGAAAIARNVKQAIEEPQAIIGQAPAAVIARESPRRKRTSFGRGVRRVSRRFDANAPPDLRTIDLLKAKERDSGVHFDLGASRDDQQQGPIEAEHDDLPIIESQPDVQPVIEEAQSLPGEQQIEKVEEPMEETRLSGPPRSTAELQKALKTAMNPQQENRPISLFDRQANAQRIEFGDGFDETQPTPGPSNRRKGKQPVQPSPRKRARSADLEDESDDDAFETEARGARVDERRQRAPVAKKVRIDPTSSAIPPSHQPPPRRNADEEHVPPQPEHEESVSETNAPDMTEEPPPSTYRAQHRLAQQNRIVVPSNRERKPRENWSHEAEEAFVDYMEMYPAKYASILQYDREEGEGLLQDRTQVNLKDKARTMAITMIKSGTGLRPGFEMIVRATNKTGSDLIAQGYSW